MAFATWIDDVRSDIESGARIGPWEGSVWRCLSRRYAADSAEGSLRATGRFHRAKDRFPENETLPALYTGCTEAIALGEVVRNAGSEMLAKLPLLCMSRLDVALSRVYRIYDPLIGESTRLLGLDFASECQGFDYENTHALARFARDHAEAILVPSCTGLRGGNLIIFPDKLTPSSRILAIETTNLTLSKQMNRYSSQPQPLPERGRVDPGGGRKAIPPKDGTCSA